MPPRHPLLLPAASAICFALMAFASKLVATDLGGGQVAFLRFLFMLAPVLAPAVWRQALTFQRRDLLFYRGFFGGTAVLLYFLAIEHLTVGIATLLNYSSPVWSVIFAALFLGERIDRRLLLPFAAAIAGMVLAGGGGSGLGETLRIGPWVAAGIASSVLSGAALAAIRAARRTESSWAIYTSFTAIGLLVTAPFGLAQFRAPTPRQWLLLGFVGAASVAGQLLMTYAYRWVTNLQAGAFSQLTVVLSLLLGVGFLGDRLAPLQIVGSGLALAGVVGVIWIQATPRAVE